MTSQAIGPKETSKSQPERLESLDQFRGYTVVGMLLVNFFGSYKVCPQVLKHTHDYCSYADTIMPQFLFAVGFALRLSFGRRMEKQWSVVAYSRMIRRLLGLVLISLVVYQVAPRATNWDQLREMGFWNTIGTPLKRDWFQTLMHIAVTSMWILPVVHCKPYVRIVWMLGSALVHVLLSHWFNFDWVNTEPRGIDGGPLGFLTWTIPAIVGTLACDVFLQPRAQLQLGSRTLNWVLLTSLFLMGLGYAISCGTRLYDAPDPMVEFSKSEKWAGDPVWPTVARLSGKMESARASGNSVVSWLAEPPFVGPPGKEKRQWNYWMMSQRSGTLAYLVFSAGFSLAVYLFFFLLSDLWGIQWSFFTTFGTNALIAYVVHMLVSDAVKSFFPKDSPAWFAFIGLYLFFSIVWLIVRRLEKDGVYLRV